MIRINLLPPELLGKKGRARVRAPAGPSPVAGGVVIALVATVFVALWVGTGYGIVWRKIWRESFQKFS